ncbi:MAG TPA: SemiSWEET family transporter [Candidatus Paceibacterota bacterium]|uniref:MtN3 and saliva related transmembrane protein n=1 Tax=Candidatus Adlerbacteria bacterium RIFCSPLOWO2_01_FULL_51_16 TaxID=1797243 RepID=A0A1F4XGX3_9BACT|nr:MAG: hypothetical protein A2943_01950 [Candidatus Adlerbacteria bacterium RIFCSPLOWO2_01_FULL_51_16]HXK31454.1 SemiSWEET family transporter [Candidatus Paceibacterota bacterium]
MTLDQLITAVVTVVGVALSVAYYPQAWRIFKNRSSQDVSVPSYVLFAVGTTTWLLYGFYKNDTPIIASFLLGAFGSWLVLLLALYFRRKKGSEGP